MGKAVKKRKDARGGEAAPPLEAAADLADIDWTAVDDAFEPVAPGDDFFGGLSEPGLMVIERLNPDKFFAARTSAPGGDGGSRKKAGKTPAKAQGGARDESGAEDDVRREKLLERARKLQEKANRLLREAGAGEADGAGAAGEGRAREGGAKRGRERAESEEGKSGSGAVEGRRGKRAKAKERAEAKAVEAEEEGAEEDASPGVDVSAWRPLLLHPRIEAALSKVGFERPTPIQKAVIPRVTRDGRDVVGAAETGSGKTLAFALPILQRLLQEREERAAVGATESDADGDAAAADRRLRALVLAPTRELALQVAEHFAAVGRPCGIRTVAIVGGISHQKQERLVGYRPEVVVATPGRLWELMSSGDHVHLTDTSGLRFLVIDEADRMAEKGHFQELMHILDRLSPLWGADHAEFLSVDPNEDRGDAVLREQERLARKRRGARLQVTRMLFSATLTLPQSWKKKVERGKGGYGGRAPNIEALVERIWRGGAVPDIVDVTSSRRLAAGVHQAHIECLDRDRDALLYYLLALHPGRTMVFCNAVSAVRRVVALLSILGLPAHAIHAQQQQRQRLRSLERFGSNPSAVLVATDVAARGIDVRGVRCVVHYQMPASLDIYVHRAGRTGRAGQEGLSVALVTPPDKPRYLALLAHLVDDLPPEFPVDPTVLPEAKARLALAMRVDDIERGMRKQKAEGDWMRRNAEEAGLEVEGDEGEGDGEGPSPRTKADAKALAQARSLRAQLSTRLAQPMQPRFSHRFFTGAQATVLAHVGGAAGAEGGEGSDAVLTASRGGVALAKELVGSRGEGGGNGGNEEPPAKRNADGEAGSSGGGNSGAAGQGGAGAGRGAGREGKKGKGKGRVETLAESRARALRDALARRGKGGKGGRAMVVVGRGALGRPQEGPDALQVLRTSAKTKKGAAKGAATAK